mmetsp:Transcript_22893/g.25861  ORF Transcript_22893/g.25861 Transcript_22893/m.25861 type:complete len:82 (+) Transcript_22893:153-398(+)
MEEYKGRRKSTELTSTSTPTTPKKREGKLWLAREAIRELGGLALHLEKENRGMKGINKQKTVTQTNTNITRVGDRKYFFYL